MRYSKITMKLAVRIAARLSFVLLAASLSIAQSPLASVPSRAASTNEDFSSVSLTTSDLQPKPPELIESTEEPGYTREWVTVQWRPKDPIYLYVVRPTKVKNPPVVIYLYGFPSETDVFRDDDWCERVTARGYAAVGFVPALTGHRYHDRSVKEWFVSELQESLAKSAHDVEMVLNYLATRGDVDMDRVGMFGEGVGGTIAVMAASVDSRIKAIDVLDPWGNWPVWMAKSKVIPDEERPIYIKPEFLQKVAAFDPVSVLPSLKTPHVRLIQLNDDFPSTPEEAKKKMEAALSAATESRRFANNQDFEGSSAADERISNWLKAQLKPAPSR